MQVQTTALQKEGTFRVYPLSWTLKAYDKVDPATGKKSESRAIAIQFGVHHQWHPDEGTEGMWSQDWPKTYDVYMQSFIIKKDGSYNELAINALRDAGLWAGDFDALAGDPPRMFCIVTVSCEDYQGKSQYRADWPQKDQPVPVIRGGGFQPADPSMLSDMRTRFGSGIKALLGGSPAAGGAPPPPPNTPGATTAPATPAAPAGVPPATQQTPAAADPAAPTPAPVDTGPDDTGPGEPATPEELEATKFPWDE